ALIAKAQTISTIAGTGMFGYNGDGIAATSAQLKKPQGLLVDAAGNILFTDCLNNRVRKINASTGIISTIAGTGTAGYNGDGIAATSAQLAAPSGVTFDISGNMYITEFGGDRIRKVDSGTNLISTIAGLTGSGNAGFNGDGIAATSAKLNGPGYLIFDG